MTRLASIALVTILVAAGLAHVSAQQDAQANKLLAAAHHKATVVGDLRGAIEDYKRIVDGAGANRALAAEALLRMAECHQKLGDEQAWTTYERVVREFSDQVAPVTAATRRLASMPGARQASATGLPLGLVCTDCTDNTSSISRDGRWIAATDWNTGDITIREAATGQIRRLLLKAGSMQDSDDYAQQPVFSSDASQIAYVWDQGKDGVPAQLRVVSRQTGAKPRVLIDNPEVWPGPLAWSSDGKQLLVELQKPDKTWQLAWVSATDGTVKVLRSLDWRVVTGSHARLSPDGRYIAYAALATNPAPPPAPRVRDTRDLSEWNVYVLAADGGTETEVTRTAGVEKHPLWSPDGSHLLFRRDRSGTWDVWVVPMREGKAIAPPIVVRRDIGTGTNLGITNAGVYHFSRLVRGLRQVSVAELDTVGRLPASIKVVDRFAGWLPSWSPDGKLLKFAEGSPLADGVTNRLILRNLATGEEKVLSRPGMGARPALWLGSNTEFLQVARTVEDGAQVPVDWYWVNLQTGASRKIFSNSGRSLVVALAADGKAMYQFAREPGAPGTAAYTKVVAVDMVTAQERHVVSLTGPADTLPNARDIGLALSPDGKTLAFVTTNPKTRDRRLYRVDVDGTQLREVFGPFKANAVDGGIAWTKDGRALLFATNDGPQWKIMRVSAAGGQPEFTGLEMRGLDSFSVSPDGSRIAFSNTSANESELWAVDLSWVWTGKR